MEPHMTWRVNGLLILLEKALKVLIDKGLPRGKEFIVRVLLKPGFPRTRKVPIFCFSRPLGFDNGILLPDWSFFNNYSGASEAGWKELQSDCARNFIDSPLENKDPVMFFEGKDTSRASGVRSFLTEKSGGFLAVNSYYALFSNITPVFEWQRYRYLLDLPGAVPWSVRFKELFLLRSVVVKVDVVNGRIPRWVNFYTDYFKEGEDFIRVNFRPGGSGLETEAALEELYCELGDVFDRLEGDMEGSQRIADSGYRKALALTEAVVVDYAARVIGSYYRWYVVGG
jgi:hypothetical protein